ncbi:hypothetical protein [Pseudonocardia sp. TRM90224]|uniref:hypothetical protein n=1 Tax=Pseudonocardia sp. TRM90224 TaxID=2812678 RepID=UPI001E2C47DC|nr:hypothetical protein [Pseudonocardia sp. TRM90224]
MYADFTAAIAAQRTQTFLAEAATHRLVTEARAARRARRALASVVAGTVRRAARPAAACA